MFRDDPFWGNNDAVTCHNLIDVLNLIEKDIVVKVLPFANDTHNKISIPLFELSDRPSDETIRKMQKLHGGYEINIYENTVPDSKWKYLLRIELLKYYNDIDINTNYSTGCYNIYDKDNRDAGPLVSIPFNIVGNDSIVPQPLARSICQKITEKFNSGVDISEW